MYHFSGKVALVTGAARRRGIGHATAVRFAMEGADVVVNDRAQSAEDFPEEEKATGWKGLDSVAEEIEAQGVRGLAVTADVSDSQQVKELVSEAIARFGRIDFLVANAGINIWCPFLEFSEADWNRILAINLSGVFYCGQAVAKHMVERGGGGAIVNLSSLGGKTGLEKNAPYCASKFGVNGLTQVMGMELAPYNIRVNAVCPGRIVTNMVFADDIWKLAQEKGIDMMEAAKIYYGDLTAATPLQRPGSPEEIANAIVFLCSDEASFITGQALNVNGGRLTAH
jgi:3-oxoacyl-[acyl-carrier protein] reductase/meso-butanediol dehydrogenase/(S,S)-butanediol dehydrogenase/diacetyl reductase